MKYLKMGLFGVILVSLLSGCVAKTPSKNAATDESLPVVEFSSSGAIVDLNSIALEWKVISDPRVDGYFIYRVDLSQSSQIGSDKNYLATVDNRFSTHYVDKRIEPSKKYAYYIRAYSKDAISIGSSLLEVASLPPLESVSWLHAVEGMPRTAKLIWRPHPNEKIKSYIIERKTLQSDKYQERAVVDGRLSVEFLDSDLKDNFTYVYRIRVKTYDGTISLPSAEVKILTKELPNEVANIEASRDLPRVIKVSWQHTPQEDFKIYRVYRADYINGRYELVAKTKNSEYIDELKEDSKEYFYRVSVVDKDNLESIYNRYTAMGKTLIKPETPSITEAKLQGDRVKISWISQDPRVVSFVVQKKHKKSIFDTKTLDIEGIKSKEFYDRDIKEGDIYYYKVFSVDQNGIRSEPSIELEVRIRDLTPEEPQVTQKSTIVEPKQEVPANIPSSSDIPQEVVIPLDDFN